MNRPGLYKELNLALYMSYTHDGLQHEWNSRVCGGNIQNIFHHLQRWFALCSTWVGVKQQKCPLESSVYYNNVQWSLSSITFSQHHSDFSGHGYLLVEDKTPFQTFHHLFLLQSKVKPCLFCVLYLLIFTHDQWEALFRPMVYIWVHYLSFEPLSFTGIVFSGRPFEKAASRQLSSITDKHGPSLSAPSPSLAVGLIMTAWCRGEDHSVNGLFICITSGFIQ